MKRYLGKNFVIPCIHNFMHIYDLAARREVQAPHPRPTGPAAAQGPRPSTS